MNRTLYLLATAILTILSLTACRTEESKRQETIRELMDIDRRFSDLSLEKGSHEAFLHYIDDSCVLLRPNRNPIIGRANIEALYKVPDTTFILTWDPLSGDVSRSGDMGYTYGIFTVKMDSPAGEKVEKKGTYVTIWKKGRDGNWKFVLDTGNQGIGSPNSVSD
ncbi:MAG TPA: nuclear transport factor 2 family protein [Bacteroidales bacterium]|nr:nuclear transport factor 2 family protein [Bacteroidales bacterium]